MPRCRYPKFGSGPAGGMPNVISTGSRSAVANARARSDGSTANDGSCASARNSRAAAAIAGAVLRPTGSPTTRTPGQFARTASTRSRAVSTTMRSRGTSDSTRCTVAASRVRPPLASGSSCFGRDGVLHGQKRSPRPPARIRTKRSLIAPRWLAESARAVAQRFRARQAGGRSTPRDRFAVDGLGVHHRLVPRVVQLDVPARPRFELPDALGIADQLRELCRQVVHVATAERGRDVGGDFEVLGNV